MAFIQFCILFMLAICCEVHGGMKSLDGNVNCSSLAANNPVINIKSDRPVAAVAKCGGGYRNFTDYGNKSYSLTGYFTGSKSGCKWKRNSSVQHKIVYELMVRVKTMNGGKRHEMMKVVSCSFSLPDGPSPSANPLMPPKGMMWMFGQLLKADLVDLRMDTTHQTRQRQSYRARFSTKRKRKPYCGRAPYVANSYRSKYRARAYQKIVYRCWRGFVPYKGVSMVKCKSNGKYSKPTPRCVRRAIKNSRRRARSCGRGRTPYVRNSRSGSRKPIKVNQMVRYSCKKGYRLYMGISSIKCRANGRFTRKPICDKVYRRSCGRTPRVRFSRSGSRRLSRLNRVIRYRCRRGFKFYKNKSTIKCLSNGKFTKPPKCIRVATCGKSPDVPNSISGSGRKSRIYQVIRYKCESGYRFMWEISAVWCRPDGRFSFTPRCVKVDGSLG